MAKGGDKKILQSNKSRLSVLLKVIVGVNVWFFFFLALWLIAFNKSVETKQYWGFALTSIVYFICYRTLQNLAEPGIDEDSGEIVYAGADITKSGGTTSYCHDILYTTVFVQFLAPFTNWAWMFFLVVPLYAGWMLWTNILGPYFRTPRPQAPVQKPETVVERKRREKAEKKAEQGRVRYRR